VLDRYTNSNLVYYKHKVDDEPYDTPQIHFLTDFRDINTIFGEFFYGSA